MRKAHETMNDQLGLNRQLTKQVEKLEENKQDDSSKSELTIQMLRQGVADLEREVQELKNLDVEKQKQLEE